MAFKELYNARKRSSREIASVEQGQEAAKIAPSCEYTSLTQYSRDQVAPSCIDTERTDIRIVRLTVV